ncbi:Fic family protein [Breznakia pachnodae]|uniref:Prophage maintenance system killer protein n=1 Tax=Breznakia pachnodae TaxID=265178 RepID=A0ABU0E4Q2_9FIRM|nr:Fic family protein [Breznakia pachnodae]MDQ0361869.1 prophage maintenance system killer protein [Breznakia pachnodae]
MSEDKNVIKFIDNELSLEVQVSPEEDTVWLDQKQLSELFDKDQSVISRHIKKIFSEGELEEGSNMQKMHIANSDKPVNFYNLDVIISVGYRVKSHRGVQFRKWANKILREYLIKGYALNPKVLSIQDYNHVVEILDNYRKVDGKLTVSSDSILDFLIAYSDGLKILDDYDHHSIQVPEGQKAIYKITYEECMDVIKKSKFQEKGDKFAIERDESFRSSIATIYQSFGGDDLYPSLEDKAAHLLYFITKNHSFFDGNKRIAATIFLYFMDKNEALFLDNKKRISEETLATLTIPIASRGPKDIELILNLIKLLIK